MKSYVRVLLLFIAAMGSAQAQVPSAADFVSAPYPFDLVSARQVDRLAWITYDEGKRNVFTSAAATLPSTRTGRDPAHCASPAPWTSATPSRGSSWDVEPTDSFVI